MPKLYGTHAMLFVRVEADDEQEARAEADKLLQEVRSHLPTGVVISESEPRVAEL